MTSVSAPIAYQACLKLVRPATQSGDDVEERARALPYVVISAPFPPPSVSRVALQFTSLRLPVGALTQSRR